MTGTINLIALAVPLFLLLIIIEYLISHFRQLQIYKLKNFINNISCGLLEQTSTLPLKGILIFTYHYISTHYAILTIAPNKISSWLLLWLGVDFLYYWLHRSCHRCNFLWVGHSVHHQSEQYNFSVALRQGIVQALAGWVFYLPLALIGFPTWMFGTVYSINLLYQFWIHTKLIQHMGWFEIFFNSPSHHRVHHGINPGYIDKNYAGSLIIWDKLFGTYAKEEEPVQYGTTEPLASWNPFYANIQVISDTWTYGKALSFFRDRIQALFMPPEWILTKLGSKQLDIPKRRPLPDTDRHCPVMYIFMNFALTLASYGYYIIIFNPLVLKGWLLGCLILVSLYTLGATLTKGRFVLMPVTECCRALLLSAIAHLEFHWHWMDASIFVFFLLINVYLPCRYYLRETNAYHLCS